MHEVRSTKSWSATSVGSQGRTASKYSPIVLRLALGLSRRVWIVSTVLVASSSATSCSSMSASAAKRVSRPSQTYRAAISSRVSCRSPSILGQICTRPSVLSPPSLMIE